MEELEEKGMKETVDLSEAVESVAKRLGGKHIYLPYSWDYDEITEALNILKYECAKTLDEGIEKNIDKIILGFPKNMDNSIGFKGELSIKVKKMLENKTNKEVILQDERLTTKKAETMLIDNDTSRKKRKKVIDAVAATIILQSYLDRKDG